MRRHGKIACRVPRASDLRGFHPDRPLHWHDYADLWLRSPLGKVLDYGCGGGGFLDRVSDRASERWGVDIDSDAIAEAGRHTGVQSMHILPGQSLPFTDGAFDTVTIVEVIEHVADERRVLGECARVLAPGGRLLLTTPHKGLLTFLDPGNVKFLSPRLHRFVHCTILQRKDYYEKRFGTVRESRRGMVADFALDHRLWHRHYSYRQIRNFAPKELETLAWDVYYPAFRALWTFRLVLEVLACGRVRPPSFKWLNNHLSRMRSHTGDQLVVLFQKKPR